MIGQLLRVPIWLCDGTAGSAEPGCLEEVKTCKTEGASL